MNKEPSDALAVQVASLRKLYGDVVAVDDVSFEVERGSSLLHRALPCGRPLECVPGRTYYWP